MVVSSSLRPHTFSCLCLLSSSVCLQPSRRPSLQPAFRVDCLSAPSPYHHYHPNQRFASQLSLYLGNPPPSTYCPSSQLLISQSSTLPFPNHCSSTPTSQSHALLYSFNNSSSPRRIDFNTESQTLDTDARFCSQTLPSGSGFHKTNPPSNSHLLSNSCSHPRHFPSVHSLSSPNLSTLPYSMSNICPHTLPTIQLQSNSNPKTLQIFPPGFQTNPSTPVKPEPNPLSEHPTVKPCGRPPLGSPAPLSLSDRERVLPVTSAHALACPSPHSQMHNVFVTDHMPCSERSMCRPLKAGVLNLHVSQCSEAFCMWPPIPQYINVIYLSTM